MEILVKDLSTLKLSPSLIVFLKCIHVKDNVYLEELNKVADVFTMAKHLESLHFIKIVGSNLNCESFEIRKIGLISYLNKLDDKDISDEQIDDVIIHFKTITKQGKLEQALKSKSNRGFISGRLKQGYSVEDLKDVIDLMYAKWNGDFKMRDYIRIQTLFNEEKFQGYIGQLETNDIKDFSDDI